MQQTQIVIAGAGLAGASAAFELRAAGYEGSIVLVGAEPHLPYNRPGLSKEYLRGEQRFEELLFHPDADYGQASIDARTGTRVVGLDPGRHTVALDTGEQLPFDRLLLATGGRNRVLPVLGSDLPGVFQLRTIDDADAIAAALRPGIHVAIAGMGFIGAEVAASLRQLGADVSVVEPGPAPLSRVLGERAGRALAQIHRGRGVRLLLNDRVAAIEGRGRVERLGTAAGETIDCDLAIVAVGIEPNVELAVGAGAAVDDGIVVDELCATTVPGIYAAGDVANTPHPIFGRGRVEHWNNAFYQGRAAARSMLGLGRPYDYVHSFWSDQYDHSIEYAGLARTWEEIVFRGTPESGRFLGFYLEGGRMWAAVGLDRGGDPEDRIRGSELKKCAELIRSRVRLDPKRLADEQWLLKDCVVPERATSERLAHPTRRRPCG